MPPWRLVEARVDFWLTDKDPAFYIKPPAQEKTWELEAAFDLKLRLERIA